MTTIIRGNGNYLSVTDDNSNGDTIILGNGVNDTVSAFGSQYDVITLGNGAGDLVQMYEGFNDTISVGNGNNDTVSAENSDYDKIIVGNGNGDSVSAARDSYDTITAGNGTKDSVFAGGAHSWSVPVCHAGDPAYQLICGSYLIEISRIRSVQVSALFSVGVSAATADPNVLGLSAMERLAEVRALVGLLLVGAPCRRAHASLQPSGRGRGDPFHWTVQLISGNSQRCSGILRSGSCGFGESSHAVPRFPADDLGRR
jgi:hypothetical protein